MSPASSYASLGAIVIFCCLSDVTSGLITLNFKDKAENVQIVDNDPEFLVKVEDVVKPLCFHIEGSDGEVLRLLQDPISGVVINAQLFYDPHLNKTYLGSIVIAKGSFRLTALKDHVMVNDQMLPWDKNTSMVVDGHWIALNNSYVAVTFKSRQITLAVRRHFVQPTNRTHHEEGDINKRSHSNGGHTTGDDKDNNNNNNMVQFRKRISTDERPIYVTKDFDRIIMSKTRRGLSLKKRLQTGSLESFIPANVPVDEEERFVPSGDLVLVPAMDKKKKEITHVQYDTPQMFQQRRHRHAAWSKKRSTRDATVSMDRNSNGKAGNSTIFLGLQIVDRHGFSRNTHGLLGQFLFKNVTMENMRMKNGRYKATLLVNHNHKTIARLITRTNLATGANQNCWRIRDQGRPVIDGWYLDYLVSSLTSTAMKRLPADADPVL